MRQVEHCLHARASFQVPSLALGSISMNDLDMRTRLPHLCSALKEGSQFPAASFRAPSTALGSSSVDDMDSRGVKVPILSSRSPVSVSLLLLIDHGSIQASRRLKQSEEVAHHHASGTDAIV